MAKPGLRIRWSAKLMDYVVETVADTTARGNMNWMIDWLRLIKLDAEALRVGSSKPSMGGREYPRDALRQELFDRGYDPETLRITVRRRAGCMTEAERAAKDGSR